MDWSKVIPSEAKIDDRKVTYRLMIQTAAQSNTEKGLSMRRPTSNALYKIETPKG